MAVRPLGFPTTSAELPPSHPEGGRTNRKRAAAVVLATAGISALVSAELFVSQGGALKGAGLVASYVSGMTMLVLPCTLPMVLVVVPLVLTKELRRGVAMALAFGAGVTLTLTVYGAVVAQLGSSLGVTTATRAMWLVGGLAAWLFGCSQLGLIKLPLPSFGMRVGRLSRGGQGAFHAFALGLLLGNAGLGCPCPPWYLLLTGVASSGSPAYGAAVGFAQGLGRVTPVLAVAVAAMLGMDATSAIMKRRRAVERGTGLTLVVLGSGIVVFMALAHSWWEATIIHAGWNHALAAMGGAQLSEIDAGGGPLPSGYWWAPWLFGAMAATPFSLLVLRSIRERRHGGTPTALGKSAVIEVGAVQTIPEPSVKAEV